MVTPREAPAVPGALRAGQRLKRAALLGALGALFAAAIAFELPLCPTATVFGVPCPGCGLTRATLRLFHGDLGGALALHPLAPALAPLVAWLAAKAALGYLGFGALTASAPSRRSSAFTSAFGAALLMALLGVWGARFLGAFGGPVSVSSPGRALFERALRREASPPASTPSGVRAGGVNSASWPRLTP